MYRATLAASFAGACLIAGCANGAPREVVAEAIAPAQIEAPSGQFRLDPTHSSLVFRASHFGLSHYTMRFTRFDATLELNAEAPAQSSVSATIDTGSIETDYPLPRYDFDAELRSPDWLNAAALPEIRFQSTGVVLTGANTGRMTGDLTIRGVTQTVELDVTFNRSFPRHPYRPNGPALLGVSARGSIKRSDFGMNVFLVAPDTPVAIGDEVEVVLELEFTGAPARATESAGRPA